jgi:hypothetical protein
MYRLHLVEPTTGKVLNSNGEYFDSRQVLDYTNTYKNLEEAIISKDELLRKVVWACVQIYDESTGEEKFYSNKEIEQQYIKEKQVLNEYLVLPWYKKLFVKKPLLKYVKT